MHSFLSYFADPRNIWLVKVFVTFVLGILVFALVYYVLHRCRRNRFMFNADILKHQKNTVQDDLQRRHRTALLELNLLTEALHDLRDRGIHHLGNEDTQAIDLKSGRIVLVRTVLPSTQPPEPYAGEDALCSMVFHAPDGRIMGSRAIRNWENATAQDIFEDVRRQLRDEIESVEARLETFETDFPNVWSFWDFFYFSTITQTTVGYGDILPNSTLIRVVVCLQIMFGYGLLVVVLNWALRHA